MPSQKSSWWWLPGTLLGLVGVLAVIGGFATGGPDAFGGVVFGGLALAAAAVILWRRAPRGSPEGEPSVQQRES